MAGAELRQPQTTNMETDTYDEVLVSIAAVINRHMLSLTMLQDDLEIASQQPLPSMTAKQKLLAAVANLLPRYPKERIALTAYLMQREANLKQLVVPLLLEYRNESGFDLRVYLSRVGAITMLRSNRHACQPGIPTFATSSGADSLRFSVIVSPHIIKPPLPCPSPEEIGPHFRTMHDATPVRCAHSELELFANLYDNGIAQKVASLRYGEEEDLYIATSDRPCFACIHYFALVRRNLNKYRLLELRTRHDFKRAIFPWQIPQGELERKYDVKYLFKEELAARLSSRFKKAGPS
ncbi:unnamed protein product [Cyclocybe aegerita]|uniref:Uncharacterized protein n=1 Tax=Cyclocybe aegerita TaxID=1973307 RepID=A0A8S0VWQ9_CYCAE|nr:unnamed protein product [Cyclocybe aegerita]